MSVSSGSYRDFLLRDISCDDTDSAREMNSVRCGKAGTQSPQSRVAQRAVDEVSATRKYDHDRDENMLTSYFKKVSELTAEEKAQVYANRLKERALLHHRQASREAAIKKAIQNVAASKREKQRVKKQRQRANKRKAAALQEHVVSDMNLSYEADLTVSQPSEAVPSQTNADPAKQKQRKVVNMQPKPANPNKLDHFLHNWPNVVMLNKLAINPDTRSTRFCVQSSSELLRIIDQYHTGHGFKRTALSGSISLVLAINQVTQLPRKHGQLAWKEVI